MVKFASAYFRSAPEITEWISRDKIKVLSWEISFAAAARFWRGQPFAASGTFG